MLGLGWADGLADGLGEGEALGDGEGLTDGDGLGEPDAEGLALGDGETDGEGDGLAPDIPACESCSDVVAFCSTFVVRLKDFFGVVLGAGVGSQTALPSKVTTFSTQQTWLPLPSF